jgi:peptide deformylase
MSILKVAFLGHPVLRKSARQVALSELSDSVTQKLIDDMFETMHEYQGIGLAAPQVHMGIRLFVAGVDDSEAGVSPVVMVNPEITPIGEVAEEDWEGCLSIPDIRGRVSRQSEILVRSLDRYGRERTMTASGFFARVIQHEADHLDGVLFLDRMSSLDSLTYLAEYNRYWDNIETSGGA